MIKHTAMTNQDVVEIAPALAVIEEIAPVVAEAVAAVVEEIAPVVAEVVAEVTVANVEDAKPAVLSEVDEHVKKLYNIVKDRVDWNDLVPTCIELAKEIENIGGLKGPEKLALLQDTMCYAIMACDLPKDKKHIALVFVKTIVPNVMKAVMIASKSPVLAQVGATCFSCFGVKK
jgi:hypothetical protein